MVLQVEAIFTNGITLASSREPHFLGGAGIDGYIGLRDQCNIVFDIVKISLKGVSLSSLMMH